MKRLIQAVSEFFEARAELLREEAASLHLGIYAAAYKDGHMRKQGSQLGRQQLLAPLDRVPQRLLARRRIARICSQQPPWRVQARQ